MVLKLKYNRLLAIRRHFISEEGIVRRQRIGATFMSGFTDLMFSGHFSFFVLPTGWLLHHFNVAFCCENAIRGKACVSMLSLNELPSLCNPQRAP